MSGRCDLLVEIGTEELPPKSLPHLATALAEGLQAGLKKHRLEHGAADCYATPRRLAVIVHAVQAAQEATETVKRGPAVAAAFTADGEPTAAAEGFARSCGVAVAALDTVETDKGAWLVCKRRQAGAAAASLLESVIHEALQALPIRKRMRWGDGEATFARPTHWSLVLFGGEAVPCRLLGTEAGAFTHGHRFHHPGPIAIRAAADYEARLRDPGKVIASFATRRERVRELAEAKARAAGLNAVIDAALLDEATALVEWPTAILASFERRFLDLPEEVLLATMQEQQKYFPCRDKSGALSERFIAVANIAVSEEAERDIARGNEKVIRPRLDDAAFFWAQDRKRKLAEYQPALGRVIFEQRLGSMLDKSRRVAKLAVWLAARLGLDEKIAQRAALLAKCDLLSDLVGEFPRLQGVMGRHYARLDGEDEAVAAALDEHYRPRFAGDALPATTHGRVLALADRLDTIGGIFAVGKAPTGEKDPYGLRRAALGALRILIESSLDLDLPQCIAKALRGYPAAIRGQADAEGIVDFMLERLRRYYLDPAPAAASDHGIDAEMFDAVLALRPAAPMDFHRRLLAVAGFSRRPEAAALIAARKRIANILRQAPPGAVAVNARLLREPAERRLAEALRSARRTCAPLLAAGDYDAVLSALAGLREAVDTFFDEVLVMSDEARVKKNRLALLKSLADLFMTVADITRLRG